MPQRINSRYYVFKINILIICDNLCLRTLFTKRDESTLRLVSFVKPLCVRCGKKRVRFNRKMYSIARPTPSAKAQKNAGI